MAEIHSLGLGPITCHAFSGNREKLALSPSNEEVHIYKRDATKWNLETVLTQHDLRVTSIDWAPNSNRIVTCSADRNAYVWSYSGDSWKPSFVVLRINRAATCVRWSPDEDKFAVGSGAKLVSVCYFESIHDWWISKHIKKPIKSTVTCIDWHPNNILIACGSTDYKVRIYSAFNAEVDKKEFTPNVWSNKAGTIGNLIAEFSSGSAWIHDLRFSFDGTKLAWVSHDSRVSIVDATCGQKLITLKTRYLPYLSCLWSSNNSLVAAGHDCCPMLFKYDENKSKLDFVEKLDKLQKKTNDGFSAMKKFQNMDKRAIRDVDLNCSSVGGGDNVNETVHQNTIKELRVYKCSKHNVDMISSVGLDGQMVIWDLKHSQLVNNSN